MGNPYDPAGKRWIAPPMWTPGSGVTFRKWLWELEGWMRLTGLPHHQRGVAVGMSVGGEAKRIAHTLDQATLNRGDGLAVLLAK